MNNGSWETNPLVTNIRPRIDWAADSTAWELARRRGVRVEKFDILLQSMLVSCSYEPGEVWHGKSEGLIGDITGNIESGQVAEARTLMDTALGDGSLWINEDLQMEIMHTQAKRLKKLAAADYGGIRLPKYVSLANTWDEDTRKPTWVSRQGTKDWRQFPQAYAETGWSSGPLREYIIYESVAPKISRAIAEGRHYVHAARDDELVAFGAFLPAEEFPCAWVSFSRPGRGYKRDMLREAGADPDASLELTRAWQLQRAPKNLLSMLYGYSHEMLKWAMLKTDGRELEGIITAINPNLGFTGSSFKAVGYRRVAGKATKYAFLEDPDGTRNYVTNRDIVKAREAGDTRPLIESKFPLLDTHELVLKFKTKPAPERRDGRKSRAEQLMEKFRRQYVPRVMMGQLTDEEIFPSVALRRHESDDPTLSPSS